MKDLSTVDGTMTKLLSTKTSELNACTSKEELVSTVTAMLKEAGIDTVASRRLIMNMKKSRSLTKAFETLYSSILYGSNLGVI